MLLLGLDEQERARTWEVLREEVFRHLTRGRTLVVDPRPSPDAVRGYVDSVDLRHPLPPEEAVAYVAEGLRRFLVHTDDPRYMGRFNPAPSEMGIVADTLVAAFNPQMAAWIYSPFPVEVEQRVIRELARELGLPGTVGGTFATGGAEANHTALLLALTACGAGFPERGLRDLPWQPTVYISREGHHSVRKAVRLAGLGDAHLREVETDAGFRMRPDALRETLDRDRDLGHRPVLVVATAGTTGSGAVDPLQAVANEAARAGAWFHVDGAWGGPLALLPEKRGILAGLEVADSVTLDAHKWLSVPMGAGLLLTRRPELMRRTFALQTGYMPDTHDEVVDPYAASIQWSRRFTGLKLFMTLAVVGWEGYRATLRHQLRCFAVLVRDLEAEGWTVVNDPSAGVVCFTDGTGRVPDADLPAFAAETVRREAAWVTAAHIGEGRTVLRLCVTSWRTTEEDVASAVRGLGEVRSRWTHLRPAAP